MSAFDAIDAITKSAAREELITERSQLRFLSYWWSKTYGRPLKDPLLQQYTLEELYYEYRLRVEYDEAATEKATEEADKIEEQKYDDALAWAEAEEAKELNGDNPVRSESGVTEEDKAWMEEQIRQAKELYGESFGEDIVEDFEDE
jgi:hypothetical protein